MIHSELSEKVIGSAMRVLNELKPGLDEKIYENALLHELRGTGNHGIGLGHFDQLQKCQAGMETNSAMSLEPLIARINTDEEGHAGTPDARAGRVLASASASQLATAISITLLDLLRK